MSFDSPGFLSLCPLCTPVAFFADRRALISSTLHHAHTAQKRQEPMCSTEKRQHLFMQLPILANGKFTKLKRKHSEQDFIFRTKL